MRCLLFGMLIFISPGTLAWYQEYGSDITGTGTYDTTGQQPVLIAFNRTNNCHSASLWFDDSLYGHDHPDKSQNINGILKVDNLRDWTLSLNIIETSNWLPGVWVLRQRISSGMIKQLRHGNVLAVSVGKA